MDSARHSLETSANLLTTPRRPTSSYPTFTYAAVVLLNVLSFWEPLRQLIKSGIDNGFIHAGNDSLIVFVDGPADPQEHDSYDWGTAGIKAIENWNREAVKPLFNWSARMTGKSQGHKEGSLAST